MMGGLKKRTIANLTGWPEALVEGLRTLLRGGVALARPEEALTISRSLPDGHVAAVLGTAERIGLVKLLSSRRGGAAARRAFRRNGNCSARPPGKDRLVEARYGVEPTVQLGLGISPRLERIQAGEKRQAQRMGDYRRGRLVPDCRLLRKLPSIKSLMRANTSDSLRSGRAALSERVWVEKAFTSARVWRASV